MPDDPGLFQTLYSTRALRRFKPDPIPDDTLFQILDAAIRAPSGQNAQDWRFVVIADPAVKQKLGEWAAQGWSAYASRFGDVEELPRTQRLSLLSVEHLVHHVAEAPVVIAVCGRKGRHSTPGGSTFPAVQNLLLAARGLGVGGSIFNLPMRPPLREMLGIPEDNDLYCLVPLGWPTDSFGPLRRKPVGSVVYWDRWGEPWPFAKEQPDEGWGTRRG